jgi:ribosomal protein L29
MADKKTTKQTVPTAEELATQLQTKQADLHDAKRSHAAGELVNPRVITQTRKEIARLKTSIRLQELGSEKESK